MMLSPEDRALIEAARQARRFSYAPYSHYPVSAAVRTVSGAVFTGVNVENAAYPSSMCAERVAIFKAVSEGERELDTLVLVIENGGTPCGACRQVMAEFNLDMRVLIVDERGLLQQETTVRQLLPGAFTADNLSS